MTEQDEALKIEGARIWHQLPKKVRRRIIREAFGGAAVLKHGPSRNMFTRDKNGESRLVAFRNPNEIAATLVEMLSPAFILFICAQPMPLLKIFRSLFTLPARYLDAAYVTFWYLHSERRIMHSKNGLPDELLTALGEGSVSKVVEIGFGASPSGLSFAAVRPRGQGFRRRLADRGFPIHRLCASGFGRKRGAPRGASALFRDTAARSVF